MKAWTLSDRNTYFICSNKYMHIWLIHDECFKITLLGLTMGDKLFLFL